MAIGDGENDVEMLELASLGIALSNGSEKTKSVANVIGLSNDEDGAADAIYRYAFWATEGYNKLSPLINYLFPIYFLSQKVEHEESIVIRILRFIIRMLRFDTIRLPTHSYNKMNLKWLCIIRYMNELV